MSKKISLIGTYYHDFYKDLQTFTISDLKNFLKDCRKDVKNINLKNHNPNLIQFLKKYGYIWSNGYIAYSEYLSMGSEHTIEYLKKNYNSYISDYENYLEPVNPKELYINMLLVNYFANKYLRFGSKKYNDEEFKNAISFLNLDLRNQKALQFFHFLTKDSTYCNFSLEQMGRIVYCHPLHVKGNKIPEYKQIIESYKNIKGYEHIIESYFEVA